MPCTTILVGKKASYDGSTMIARNDDSPSGQFTPKKFVVVHPEEQPKKQADAPASLLSFADNSKLMWPVDGNVILNYSMDKSIYFETLNQYKYHPAIVIGAEEGTEVWCAARGEVSDIRVDEETGTTLTMALGSGYEAVYGQLKELAVKEGDMVDAGALIGYVSEPTKYYTVEGSNLYFQLLKDGNPVDPMSYLE